MADAGPLSGVVTGTKSKKRRLKAEARQARALAAVQRHYEALIRSYKAEIEKLRSAHEEHLRTCPAAGNQRMLEQGEATTFAGVHLAAGASVFHAHKAILASRSPVFASMLNLPMREGTENFIGMEGMSAKGLEEFLFFLYTGHFRKGFDALELGEEVLAAAHKYNVGDLEETLRPLFCEDSTDSTTHDDDLVD